MDTKQCTCCLQNLPEDDFYPDHRNPERRRPRCKQCHNAASTKNYEANKRQWRATFYKRKYGISIDKYEEMLLDQDHACAVCGKPETSEKFSHLSVDHDHDTGEVRGLLCASCNRLLGLFEANRDLFVYFPIYLKEKQ